MHRSKNADIYIEKFLIYKFSNSKFDKIFRHKIFFLFFFQNNTPIMKIKFHIKKLKLTFKRHLRLFNM